MKRDLLTAVWFTLVTTLLLGVLYPLAVTGLSELLFAKKADGQLIEKNGRIVGSAVIGQVFTGLGYFHSRPSNAGTGYDASSSGASNLAPTNKALIDRVTGDVRKEQAQNSHVPVPVDLVTASGSGLDPDISPAAAEFQVARVANERNMNPDQVRALVRSHTLGRQFGLLGEPRVNVLELNLELDAAHPLR